MDVYAALWREIHPPWLVGGWVRVVVHGNWLISCTRVGSFCLLLGVSSYVHVSRSQNRMVDKLANHGEELSSIFYFYFG